MKIGLFGGSFDPIHYGHIRPVKAAQSELGLDRVLYLPTAHPPHKSGRQFAPAHARYAMVELALLHEEGLFASPYELTLDRAAYTVDTVEHFRHTLPQAQLFLILGADAFSEVNQWHRWRDLVSTVDLVVLLRPGWESTKMETDQSPELRELRRAGRLHFVSNPPIAASSTELRQRLIQDSPPPADLLPQAVVDYVQKYSLYR